MKNPISLLLYFLAGCCMFSFGLAWWQVVVLVVMFGLVELINKEKM